MFFRKKELQKELVMEADFTTIECSIGNQNYFIFPSLYKKTTENGKVVKIEEILADEVSAETRSYFKAYLLGKYLIDKQPPAHRVEDIINDIKLSFEPILHLMKKYPNAITFHSNENDKNKPLPYVINIDIAVLDNFIKDLL